MIPFLTGLVLLYTVNTYATCMSECVENEKDVTVTTSCAAPGGPVRTTSEVFKDYCGDESFIKYSCGGDVGMRYPLTKFYSCKKCSDESTCEEIVPGFGL